jgi:hypothetical protein
MPSQCEGHLTGAAAGAHQLRYLIVDDHDLGGALRGAAASLLRPPRQRDDGVREARCLQWNFGFSAIPAFRGPWGRLHHDRKPPFLCGRGHTREIAAETRGQF